MTAELDAALDRIKRAGAGKSTQAIENSYGQAYQRLVRAGLKPKLRAKYRP